jgi:hypothetical protein
MLLAVAKFAVVVQLVPSYNSVATELGPGVSYLTYYTCGLNSMPSPYALLADLKFLDCCPRVPSYSSVVATVSGCLFHHQTSPAVSIPTPAN